MIDSDLQTSFTEKRGKGFRSAIRFMVRWSTYLAAVPVVLMMLLIFFDVFARYIGNHAIIGVIDMVELSMVITVFLTTASTAEEDEHVQVDVLVSRFQGRFRRLTKIISVGACLLTSALLAWRLGARGVSEIFNPTRFTNTLRIPFGPFLLVAAIGFILLMLVFLVKLMDIFNGEGTT